MPPPNVEHRLDRLDNAVFGDRDDPVGRPGIIAEQRRTNEILTELKADGRRLTWVVLSGVVTGMLALLFRGVQLPGL